MYYVDLCLQFLQIPFCLLSVQSIATSTYFNIITILVIERMSKQSAEAIKKPGISRTCTSAAILRYKLRLIGFAFASDTNLISVYVRCSIRILPSRFHSGYETGPYKKEMKISIYFRTDGSLEPD